MKRILVLPLVVLILLLSGVSVVSAGDLTKTDTDPALGTGTVRDTASCTGDAPGWTIHVRPGVRFSDRDRVIAYLDFLVPLYFTDRSLLFFNPKASFDSRNNVEWNVGVGYRHLLADDRLILGGSVFYDRRRSQYGNDFNQIGIGAEVMTEWVTGRINGYIELSDPQEIDRWKEYYFAPTSINYTWAYNVEEPLPGLDYEIGFKVPGLSDYVETWVYGGGYNFFADYTDDMAGWSARIEMIPTDFVKLNFSVRDDNLGGTEYAGEVTLELPFSIDNLLAGKDPFEGIGHVFGGSRTMKERLYEQVRRDVDIVIESTAITRATHPDDVIPGDPSEFVPVVYVDDSNTSATEDGTLYHPWSTINEGLVDSRILNNTVSTVYVFAGLYDERLLLDRSLTLLGASYGVRKFGYVVPVGYNYNANRESIIRPSTDANEPVINITAARVTLNGFIVANEVAGTNGGSVRRDLISLSNQAIDYTNVRILNCVLGPNQNTASPGSDNGRCGIAVWGPSTSKVTITIRNNKIFDANGNGCGILLLGPSTSTGGGGTGNGLNGKYSGSVIEGNEIIGNHRSGIELAGGCDGSPGNYFRIINNTISGQGGGPELRYGNGIVIIRTGSTAGNPLGRGAKYLLISGNRITNNEKNGIYIGPNSAYITITGNTISNNGTTGAWDGIRVDLNEDYHPGSADVWGQLRGISVRYNTITGNGGAAGYGVRVLGVPTLGPINATNNWWGDPSGPGGVGPGTGDAVSDNVLYNPWLTEP